MDNLLERIKHFGGKSIINFRHFWGFPIYGNPICGASFMAHPFVDKDRRVFKHEFVISLDSDLTFQSVFCVEFIFHPGISHIFVQEKVADFEGVMMAFMGIFYAGMGAGQATISSEAKHVFFFFPARHV